MPPGDFLFGPPSQLLAAAPHPAVSSDHRCQIAGLDLIVRGKLQRIELNLHPTEPRRVDQPEKFTPKVVSGSWKIKRVGKCVTIAESDYFSKSRVNKRQRPHHGAIQLAREIGAKPRGARFVPENAFKIATMGLGEAVEVVAVLPILAGRILGT
jgi:hypothetical protein